MSYEELRNELLSDPLGRGYAGMTDEEASIDLNTKYRTRPLARLQATEVLQNIDAGEYAALSQDQKAQLWGLLGIGDLNPWGVEATLIQSLFGGGSATLAALAAARNETISRAVELGLGVMKPGYVGKARS